MQDEFVSTSTDPRLPEASEPSVERDGGTESEASASPGVGAVDRMVRVVVLSEYVGRKPESEIPDEHAELTLAAISAPWHPDVLSRVDRIPTVRHPDDPISPEIGEVWVSVQSADEDGAIEKRMAAESNGATWIELAPGTIDRPGSIRTLVRELAPTDDAAEPTEDPVVSVFLAIGAMHYWLQELTVAMEHVDCLDADRFGAETLGAAKMFIQGDRPGAENRLRAGFELMAEARERFYPVEAFLIDLGLLDESTPADALDPLLDEGTPVTLLASAASIESMAERNPKAVARLREAINDGVADVIGGTYRESAEPFRPLETILWQFRRGSLTYRKHLDDRTVETLAGRRFAFYPMRPQIARRFGFRYGLHLAFDSGSFPLISESKRLWESPEGAHLESLTRVPLDAARSRRGIELPWKIAESMRNDHVATLGLVHWPHEVASWFRDLRTSFKYAGVLARPVTVGDYFHLSDRPYETLRPKLDEYKTPYLEQAVERGDPSPIQRRCRHWRLRARLDGVLALHSIALALRSGHLEPGDDQQSTLDEIERLIESGDLADADSMIATVQDSIVKTISRSIAGVNSAEGSDPNADDQPGGILLLNPLSVARRIPVPLPADSNLPTAGTVVRAAQFVDGLPEVIATVPAFGFGWVGFESSGSGPHAPSDSLKATGREIRNESIRIEFDPNSGGLRGVMAAGETEPRLAQKLVVVGLSGVEAHDCRAEAGGFKIDTGGPAVLVGTSEGSIVHPEGDRTLVKFRQRIRLWTGRPMANLEIELLEIDPELLVTIQQGPAWSRYIGCRWAWPDTNATLRRSSMLQAQETLTTRPETAEFFEINARRNRTSLIFGGLAHHQRHGDRMLDTILVAGREQARRFEIGIAMDLEHGFQAVLDLINPPIALPLPASSAPSVPTGWLFRLDARSVVVTRIEPATIEGGGPGIAFHLLETSGGSVRARLRMFREPVAARQTDCNDEKIIELTLEGDAVLLDLTPYEFARVVVGIG